MTQRRVSAMITQGEKQRKNTQNSTNVKSEETSELTFYIVNQMKRRYILILNDFI